MSLHWAQNLLIGVMCLYVRLKVEILKAPTGPAKMLMKRFTTCFDVLV